MEFDRDLFYYLHLHISFCALIKCLLLKFETFSQAMLSNPLSQLNLAILTQNLDYS